MDIGTVLRGLYESEINAGISWLWDGGFDWWVGGDFYGGVYENCDAEGTERTVEQAAQAMHEAALRCYPDSEYAKRAREPKPDFDKKLRRIREVRDITGCCLVEAKDAIEANDTVDKAVAAIRQRQESMGLIQKSGPALEAAINAVAGPILAKHFKKEA